jgi:flagellar assembly protein FliH
MSSSTSRAAEWGSAKFLFDTNFEDALAVDAAEADADVAVLSSYTRAEIDALRAAAFAEGRVAGRAEAMVEIERQTAAAIEATARGLEALMRSEAQFERSVADHAVALGCTLLRKLHPELMRRHGAAEVEALIARCLERLHAEPRIVVRLHDGMLDLLRPRLDEIARLGGYEGRVILVADDAIAPGDCRIEWAEGGCERDSARLWRDIEVACERVLADSRESDHVEANRRPAGRPEGE